MITDPIQTAALKVANLIADGRYDSAVQACSRSRLTDADIANVIGDYGRTFVRVPAEYSNYLDVVSIAGRLHPTWSIRAPLWTLEEGRSDLTLELTVAEEVGCSIIELDDLKVM